MLEVKEKRSYLANLLRFYFAPEFRSIVTIPYLGIFGFFTVYYLDNIILAGKFIAYVLSGHTALLGTTYLFTGMTFVVSLAVTFFAPFYSIFVLYRIWNKIEWSGFGKLLMTILIILFGTALIVVCDESARIAAKESVMQGFIEDSGLSGKF